MLVASVQELFGTNKIWLQLMRKYAQLRHGSQIWPQEAVAGRNLAPALHSKACLTICSRTQEEFVLTWLACCDRTHSNSFLITIGANGVL